MKRHFCASAFIINPINKKILLAHHSGFNRWVQPGGHIEDFEVPEETAIREVYEETGVKVRLLGERFPREDDYIRPLGIQKNRGKQGDIHIDIIYVGVPISVNEVSEDDEVDKFGWFSREELDDLDIFEDIKITMDYILKNYIK